jgi:hypothetical protein
VSQTGAMKFTVEERADRFQRRYTGPWRTETRGPVQLRYRRRTHIDFVRFSVAGHDLWTHALLRGVIVPTLMPFLRWLARVLG